MGLGGVCHRRGREERGKKKHSCKELHPSLSWQHRAGLMQTWCQQSSSCFLWPADRSGPQQLWRQPLAELCYFWEVPDAAEIRENKCTGRNGSKARAGRRWSGRAKASCTGVLMTEGFAALCTVGAGCWGEQECLQWWGLEPRCPKGVRDIPAAGAQSAELITLLLDSKHIFPWKVDSFSTIPDWRIFVPENIRQQEYLRTLWGQKSVCGEMWVLYPLQKWIGAWPQTPALCSPHLPGELSPQAATLMKQNWAKGFFSLCELFLKPGNQPLT